MSTITSTGLGSGLDINGLVTKLVSAESTPITTSLDKKEAALQAKISAFGSFKGSLSSLQDSLTALSKPQTFQKVNATSSDASFITATASANADLGNYKVEVRQLAQTHAIASGVYSTPSTVVGTGTMTIKFGTTNYNSDGTYKDFTLNQEKPALSLTIDSSNNTLTGIRDAINKANSGINASVINNGSGYQLVLNSTDSGVKNSMQIEITDSDSNNTDNVGLSALAFNKDAVNMKQSQSAQDAQIAINGLAVTSNTNTVSDAVKGVTFNLQQAQIGKIISVGVSQSYDDINTALTTFVGKYNDLLNTISTTASYDSKNKSAGALLGESSVLTVMGRLRAEITKSVTGLTGSVRSLADVGVTTQKDGSLSFDSSKLSKAFTTDRSAVTALFAVTGRPSDSSVIYVSSSSKTVAGSHPVNITQAATQGTIKGAVSTGSADGFNIGDNNSTFKITVNGVSSGDIVLTKGVYSSGTALAAELQSRINGDSSLKTGGVAVKVSYTTDNQFVIQSNRYGSDSTVKITSASSETLSMLGLTAINGVVMGTDGQDVAGTIGGQSARGMGQLLTAIPGEDSNTPNDAEGLSVFVDDARTGDRGNVNFSRGIMEEFSSILSSALGTNGLITTRTQGINTSLTGIGKQRTDLTARMTRYQAQLLVKFNAMDSLLGQMQATSSYLTQQITAMNSANKSN